MTIFKILAINLKYYRKIYNMSQERFAEVLGTSLAYLNEIENQKRNVSLKTIAKFTRRLNAYDESLNLKFSTLLNYDESLKTNYKRIDEKKKPN